MIEELIRYLRMLNENFVGTGPKIYEEVRELIAKAETMNEVKKPQTLGCKDLPSVKNMKETIASLQKMVNNKFFDPAGDALAKEVIEILEAELFDWRHDE